MQESNENLRFKDEGTTRLSGQVKKNTFWAYNYEHLEYLKDYIEAKLRTRSGKSYTSMVEKLPNWIKSKKNKEELIKLIEKLEKTARTQCLVENGGKLGTTPQTNSPHPPCVAACDQSNKHIK